MSDSKKTRQLVSPRPTVVCTALGVLALAIGGYVLNRKYKKWQMWRRLCKQHAKATRRH